MAPIRGPAVPRRRLGAELRRLREQAGLLIEQAAERLECSTSKISRLETGKGIPRARDVRDLLEIYGVEDDKKREQLMRWAREGQKQGWWQKYSDVLKSGKLLVDHIETLYALEADASTIRIFQSNVVPGLLQTRGYARELLRTMLSWLDEEEIDRLVEVRMVRQQLLHRSPDPLRLRCVLDEAVVLRSLGGPEIMRDQLRHLLELERPNVTVQVLPLASRTHPAVSGPFVVLEFEDSADRDMVYVEGYAGSAYLEQPHDVELHEGLFQKCEEAALSPADSATLIATHLNALVSL